MKKKLILSFIISLLKKIKHELKQYNNKTKTLTIKIQRMQINPILNVSDYYFDVFMSISEALTGFSVNELQSTGLATDYYTHILGEIELATFTAFLNTSRRILESSSDEEQLVHSIKTIILSAPATKGIADNVITLWYLGTWEGSYVNDRSYKEGLVWNVMHSHPPGAKQPGYKSWAIQPVNSKL
ncbi:hypothetical protein ASG22_01315 [Chryseobacterium sp. Leaf405]|nr:hypothetical protein ASG22_01315 [Chryseobacterium sp. Leaf405]